jgi:hypothetical protein
MSTNTKCNVIRRIEFRYSQITFIGGAQCQDGENATLYKRKVLTDVAKKLAHDYDKRN